MCTLRVNEMTYTITPNMMIARNRYDSIVYLRIKNSFCNCNYIVVLRVYFVCDKIKTFYMTTNIERSYVCKDFKSDLNELVLVLVYENENVIRLKKYLYQRPEVTVSH